MLPAPRRMRLSFTDMHKTLREVTLKGRPGFCFQIHEGANAERDTEQSVDDESGTQGQLWAGDALMRGVSIESHNTSEIAKGVRQVEKNTRSKL